jgi:hypothetical protein
VEDCNWEGQEHIKMRICSSAGAVEDGWLLRSGAVGGGRQAAEQSEGLVGLRLPVIPDGARRMVLTGARHQPPGARASEFAHAGPFGDAVNGAEASAATTQEEWRVPSERAMMKCSRYGGWVVSGKPARKRWRWRRVASQQAAQQDEGGAAARASEGMRASAEQVRGGS